MLFFYFLFLDLVCGRVDERGVGMGEGKESGEMSYV